jgi:hypothetical protein
VDQVSYTIIVLPRNDKKEKYEDKRLLHEYSPSTSRLSEANNLERGDLLSDEIQSNPPYPVSSLSEWSQLQIPVIFGLSNKRNLRKKRGHAVLNSRPKNWWKIFIPLFIWIGGLFLTLVVWLIFRWCLFDPQFGKSYIRCGCCMTCMKWSGCGFICLPPIWLHDKRSEKRSQKRDAKFKENQTEVKTTNFDSEPIVAGEYNDTSVTSENKFDTKEM